MLGIHALNEEFAGGGFGVEEYSSESDESSESSSSSSSSCYDYYYPITYISSRNYIKSSSSSRRSHYSLKKNSNASILKKNCNDHKTLFKKQNNKSTSTSTSSSLIRYCFSSSSSSNNLSHENSSSNELFKRRKQQEQINILDIIPNEVVITIFSYLSSSDITTNIIYTSTRFKSLGCSKCVWLPRLYNDCWVDLSFMTRFLHNNGTANNGTYANNNDWKVELLCNDNDNDNSNNDCINYPELYTLYQPYPYQMDITDDTTHSKEEGFETYEMMMMDCSSSNNTNSKSLKVKVYQFYSSTWHGDRSLRSSIPFPSLDYNADHTSINTKTSTSRLPKQFLNSIVSSMHKYLLRISANYQYKQTSLRPFVSPTISKVVNINNNNNRPLLQLNVKPRYIAYYEITILKRDLEQEPHYQQTTTTSSSSSNHLINRTSINNHTPECIAIGLSTKHFNTTSKMPGWDQFSYGYHSDDGGIYHNNGTMIQKYGPSFTIGDTIGCGICYKTSSIFFTKNGLFLGYAWKHLKDFNNNPNKQLLAWYPTIGIDTDCPINVNFGNDNQTFVFDLCSI